MEQKEPCHPIPAPRRLYPEARKSDYENVTIDLINKNLNINSENIHTVDNCLEKLPNNKVFLVGALSENEDTNANSKINILTETNDLYGPNANEQVPDTLSTATIGVPTSTSTPTPAPRPRKPQNNDVPVADNQDVYENTDFVNRRAAIAAALNSPQTPHRTVNGSGTGAISKNSPSAARVTRKAPELPPKTYLNVDRFDRSQRNSIGSEFSTTSGSNWHANGSYDLADRNFSNTKLSKSGSNITLNSSIADSTESSENSKYKSPSPRDILKSLGSTSKLLSESIGERVAQKAKGAKHKLDKNLKTSSEVLSNLGQETTSRLRNASKRFGTNFTLTKKDKSSNESKDDSMSGSCDTDRPQTMPPSDKVFERIAFSSPLQAKAAGVTDLSGTEEVDHSYEVPRNVSIARNNLDCIAPPSYEDALKAASKESLTPIGRSPVSQQRNNFNLSTTTNEKTSKNFDRASKVSSELSSPSPPMPNFPPPPLPSQPPDRVVTDPEAIYGKLNPIKPPARQKRHRKNYEEIQLRRVVDNPSPVGGSSMRANIDSVELNHLHMDAALSEREASLLLRENIKAAEACTPKPDRSDSWEYFEEKDDYESDCSSPEPVYANHEATYGKVFEMATSGDDLLPPNVLVDIGQEAKEESFGAGGDRGPQPPKEIIQEFDPLLKRRTLAITKSNKSNELLLLEHLLEEETYGTSTKERSRSDDDDISMCTSEEDGSGNGAAAVTTVAGGDSTNKSPSVAKAPLPKTVVLPSPSLRSEPSTSEAARQIQIVHQNAHLMSESMENVLDAEARVKPFLSKVEEKPGNQNVTDLSRPSANRSHWFDQNGKEKEALAGGGNSCNKLSIEGGESPPSYLEAIGADGRSNSLAGEQKSRAARFMSTVNTFSSNMKIRVEAFKGKSSFRASQKSSADVKVTLQMVPRPTLSPLLVRYEGPLIRFPSGVVEDILKEMQNRKAILRDRQFQTFLDQEMKTPKEVIPLEYITTLQCVSNHRAMDNITHFYCFEITTSVPKNSSSNSVQAMSNPNLVMTSNSSGNCKHQRVSHMYGVGKESERGVWMQKLLESLTNTIPPKYICHFYRAGWCYLKHSITSEWSGTWLVLRKSQRRLVFVTESSMNVEKMDLRKARCLVLKESDETIRNLHVESGPMLMIDCPPYTVYMIMSSPRETKIWRHIIREVAHNNGFELTDQQLTKFNVPVIVDKCINFVYIHGSISEGIYRKSGSENSILKLLAAFRADAFNVEITRNEYNEHDVANVLKRFMRDLPEHLIGKLSESFMCVSELGSATEKIETYRDLLARLTVIERETLKKIVGHLAFISSQKNKNKMSVRNLTMIWGPTLLKQSEGEEMIYSQKEADVLTDLITLHKNIFNYTLDELKKEQEMLMYLQKYYASAETLTDTIKKSGDLKMWITINPRPEDTTEEKLQVNVTISPTKTAYEICKEVAPKMNMSVHNIALHEIIVNGHLERPLHHDTKVFDVVLNWSYWPEDDRKNNILVVKPIDILREVDRAIKNLASVTPGKELKFADCRTKSYKTFMCELRDGKVVVSKKEKNDKTTIVKEIFLHSSTAYLGCEKKRDFPWSWAITFVEKTQSQILRSRDSPFIGHVMAGSEWVDRSIWYSSIWYSLYGDSILPPPEILIK